MQNRPEVSLSDDATQYLGQVAAELATLGYRVTDRFTTQIGGESCHVFRIGLNGPIVELTWDLLMWRVTTYPSPASSCDEVLSTVLHSDSHAARAVARAAHAVFGEARRRWGRPDPVCTWTFFGHWENCRIVVDSSTLGDVDDVRHDDGRWPEGLWAASGSGTTIEQARARVLAEYEQPAVTVLTGPAAEVGIPTWNLAADVEINLLEWAEWLLTKLAPGTRLQVAAAVEVPLLSVAQAVRDRGPDVTWEQLLASMLAELMDTVHGAGVGFEVDVLMSWWRSLTEEERELTGVDLPAETSMPPADDDGSELMRLYPAGRLLFYEGDDPVGFAHEVAAELGFDPSDHPDFTCQRGWQFHCPADRLQALYVGADAGRWVFGS